MKATQVGRNLRLEIEGLESITVQPLKAKHGLMLTQGFTEYATKGISNELWEGMLLGALDGFDENDEPIRDGTNYAYLQENATLAEGEQILHAAFYWQTILGMDGVNAYLDEGGGVGGALKVMSALLFRLGLSHLTTSPNTESVNADPMADTSTTSSQKAGTPRLWKRRKPSQP